MQKTKFEYIEEKLIHIHSQVTINKGFNLQDINIRAEDMFMHILNDVYDYELVNANKIKDNFPTVDLIDEQNKIVVQVTSSIGTEKINHTLEGIKKFKDNESFKKYSDYKLLFLYIIEEKKALSDKFKNDRGLTDDNFCDITDMLKKIQGDLDIEEKVYNTLERIFIDKRSELLISSNFIKTVFEELTFNRLLVLFSQDFTEIQENQNFLKLECKNNFGNNFYIFSVPPFLDDSRKYFQVLIESCGLSAEVDSPYAWKTLMQLKLSKNPQRMMLFITDIEDGNRELNKQFAKIILSLVAEFSNLYVIFSGRKNLASLVYIDGNLSPLNTAKELFFPDTQKNIDTEKIKRQFLSLREYSEPICKYLKKDSLGLHATWSPNEIINILFWKNLLVKDGKKFVWCNKLTKEIGIDIFECNNVV